MPTITLATCQSAFDAIRDILYMYFDMSTSYDGFGHGIDLGRFNPLDFIDTKVEQEPGCHMLVDEGLLQGGSGIALLCILSDSWDELDSADPDSPALRPIWNALQDGRLHHLPDIEDAVRLAFENEQQFRSRLPQVFGARVKQFFAALS
jgi:hypothetical protein